MRIILCSALLVFVFSASAQAPVPAPLAHGDVPGEPHHHLKIENEYVRAYYVEVAPHDETQLHQHDHDYIFVSLGAADIINAPLNKPELHQVLKDGEMHFARGPFAHVARNLADTPFRNVTVELLKPQDNLQNLCEKIVEGELGECHPTENRWLFSKPYFRSTEMAVSIGTLKPKAEFTGDPQMDQLLVAMDQAEIQVSFPDRRLGPGSPHAVMKLHPGGMLWVPANQLETIKNLHAEPSSFMLVSFRDSRQSVKP